VHAAKGDVRHIVQLFDRRNVMYVRGDKVGQPWPLTLPPGTTSLLVRWFVEVDTPSGLVHCLAAYGSWHSGRVCSLVDIRGALQASMAIGDTTTTTTTVVETPRLDTRVMNQWIATANRASTSAIASTVVFVDELRRMPLLWATVHAMDIQTDGKSEERLFQHWRDLTRCEQGQTDTQWLARLLALPSLAWVYRPDYVHGDDTGIIVDMWSNLWSFPDPGACSYDCEDGSKALLEVFHVFCRSTFQEDAHLRALQALARSYRAHLAVVDIDSNDPPLPHNYGLHALVVLLGPHLPAIVLESTAYASAPWPSRKEMLARVHQDKRRFTDEDAQQPASMWLEQNKYGRVYSLTSSDARSSEHIVFTSEVAFTDVLFGEVALPNSVISVPASQARSVLAPFLSYLPPCRLPSAPSSTTTTAPSLHPQRGLSARKTQSKTVAVPLAECMHVFIA
jgi:hypothetical protein